MKKTILALTIRHATAVLVALFSGPAMAKVTGRCDNCHTMHNSQGGAAMAEDRSSWYGSWPELGTPPYGILLTDTCVGCHLRPAHHADDSNVVVGSEDGDDDGFYRFLSGHYSGDTHGVCGIEDDDWQADCGTGDHNEYLGFSGDKEDVGSFFHIGHHTMTAFCCGCHGNFHIEQSSVEWLRHPSDAVIPDAPGSEYADAFGANGTGTCAYDPIVPVARPSLTGWTVPRPGVTLDTNMVMCLSCHTGVLMTTC